MLVSSVANVDSITPVQTEFGNPNQTSARDSVLASMMKDMTTSPTDSEISGIDNSELKGEGSKGENSSSSESPH